VAKSPLFSVVLQNRYLGLNYTHHKNEY